MQKFSAIVSNIHALPATVPSKHLPARPALTPPTTIEECRALKAWADAVGPQPETPATVEQINRHMMFLKATLPSQQKGELAGQMQASVFTSILSGYSDAALNHMVRRVCETHDWFPTPKACLDALKDWVPPVSDQETALRLCQDFATSQFDRWLTNVTNGQPVGDVPDQWPRIAVEQGILRRLSDGSYVSRALYHGPALPVPRIA